MFTFYVHCLYDRMFSCLTTSIEEKGAGQLTINNMMWVNFVNSSIPSLPEFVDTNDSCPRL